MLSGIRAWTVMTTIMFALSVPAALVGGRWVMVAWPVGYVALRLLGEYYTRRDRKAADAR